MYDTYNKAPEQLKHSEISAYHTTDFCQYNTLRPSDAYMR